MVFYDDQISAKNRKLEEYEQEIESLRAKLAEEDEELQELQTKLAEAEKSAKCRKECLEEMISYLNHFDQDANHEWMVVKMRDAAIAKQKESRE